MRWLAFALILAAASSFTAVPAPERALTNPTSIRSASNPSARYVNPEKIGITGSSYGGYMALMAPSKYISIRAKATASNTVATKSTRWHAR